MRRWVRSLLLVAVWIGLWGELTVANVASGLVVVVVVEVSFPARRVAARHGVNPVGLVRFAAGFVVDLVRSAVGMVVVVLRPTPSRLAAGIVAVPLETRSTLVMELVANALTLTPGTLTVEVRGGESDPTGVFQPFVLYVHTLGLQEPDALRRLVGRIEARASAAFPSAAVSFSRWGA